MIYYLLLRSTDLYLWYTYSSHSAKKAKNKVDHKKHKEVTPPRGQKEKNEKKARGNLICYLWSTYPLETAERALFCQKQIAIMIYLLLPPKTQGRSQVANPGGF